MINGFDLLLGHLIGDYLLQNQWMAENKTKDWKACFLHCFFYSCAIVMVLYITGHHYMFRCFITAFLSHYFIDRYRLGYKWMEILNRGSIDTPFFPVLYCVIDNTFHLVLMYMSMRYLL